jgi:biotin operon repressor
MRVHSLSKIEKLKRLRKHGHSINELVEELQIPKTTVWHHVQGVRILSKYVASLKAKRGGSIKRKQNSIKLAKELAEKLLNGPDRELIIAFSMLYWGEGSKSTCEFINSDGRIIQVYLKILRKVFKIDEDLIKPTIRIFTGMSEIKSLNYWSKITDISKRKFRVRLNDGGTRGKTKYGMCRITVCKGAKTLKLIHSLIDQIYKEIIK